MIRESQTMNAGRPLGSEAVGGVGADAFRSAHAADPLVKESAPPVSDPDVFAPVRKHLQELYTFAVHYAATQADRFRLQARNAALFALLGVGGMVAVATTVAYSVIVLITGIAHGLAALFGPDYLWVAELVTGAGVLLVLALATWTGLKYVTDTCLTSTKLKYERRRAEERAALGKDVSHRGN